MSYAPASPDLSSFYSGSAAPASSATTTTNPIANPPPPPPPQSSTANLNSTRPLFFKANPPPSGLALPASPTPTTRQPLYQAQGQQPEFSSQQHRLQVQQGYYYAPNPQATHPHQHPHPQPQAHAFPPQSHSHFPHHQHPQQQQQQQQLHPQQTYSQHDYTQVPLQAVQAGPFHDQASDLTAQAGRGPPPQAHQHPQFFQQYGGQQHFKLEPENQPYTPAQGPPHHPGAFAQLPPHQQQPHHQQNIPHVKSEFKTEFKSEESQSSYLSYQENNNNNSSSSNNNNNMPPRRSAGGAAASTIQVQPLPPAIMPSPVRTKFPTARIKRIMQADEEVGKVAQQTPIAVGKALELFMVALVSKSHDVAQDKGAKRVTAQHLKQVIEGDDQWDFLREIVGRVSETDERAGKGTSGRAGSGGKAAESEESEEEPELAAPAVEVKKKGRGGGRKKKNA